MGSSWASGQLCSYLSSILQICFAENILLYLVFSLQYTRQTSLKRNMTIGMQRSSMHCAQRLDAAHQGWWRQHFLDSLVHFTFAK